MKRYRLPELEDQPWFPDVIRRAMTDYLRFVMARLPLYDAAIPVLADVLRRTGLRQLIDLGSGAGGYMPQLQPKLSAWLGEPVRVVLTDKYPHVAAYRQLRAASGGQLDFVADSVDATRPLPDLPGVRTLFTAFHHFDPPQARAILADAVRQRVPIAVFEGASKHPLELVFILIATFPLNWLSVLATQPRSWRRIFFTFIVPIVPMAALWDGLASILRLYSPTQLRRLCAGLATPDYTFRTGYLRHRTGARLIYLVGEPVGTATN